MPEEAERKFLEREGRARSAWGRGEGEISEVKCGWLMEQEIQGLRSDRALAVATTS